MAIEKKTKYMVWTLEAGLSCLVDAYIENGEVAFYRHWDDSDVYTPNSYERFFDTQVEAEEYITNRIAELKGMAKEVRSILEEMDGWEDSYDGDQACNAPRLADFIPDSVLKRYKREWDAKAYNMVRELIHCARDRAFEVAKCTVPMDSVSHISWNDIESKATIALHDGTSISVNEREDYNLLGALYGHRRPRSGEVKNKE